MIYLRVCGLCGNGMASSRPNRCGEPSDSGLRGRAFSGQIPLERCITHGEHEPQDDAISAPRSDKNGQLEMDETERAELIATLHQAATFAEALLDLNTRLLDALTTGENRPDVEELEYLRAGLSRWREQLATLRQRIAGLTFEPPERMQ